jgi:hypothetical protein
MNERTELLNLVGQLAIQHIQRFDTWTTCQQIAFLGWFFRRVASRKTFSEEDLHNALSDLDASIPTSFGHDYIRHCPDMVQVPSVAKQVGPNKTVPIPSYRLRQVAYTLLDNQYSSLYEKTKAKIAATTGIPGVTPGQKHLLLKEAFAKGQVLLKSNPIPKQHYKAWQQDTLSLLKLLFAPKSSVVTDFAARRPATPPKETSIKELICSKGHQFLGGIEAYCPYCASDGVEDKTRLILKAQLDILHAQLWILPTVPLEKTNTKIPSPTQHSQQGETPLNISMPTCFVIQPFDNDSFDQRYKDTFKPAITQAGFKAYRVDEDFTVDIPIAQIHKGIREAAACFVEITKDNPNVWYELGYALACEKPLCLVCEKTRRRRFPFDIQHLTIIQYSARAITDFDDLQRKIVLRLEAIRDTKLALQKPPDIPQDTKLAEEALTIISRDGQELKLDTIANIYERALLEKLIELSFSANDPYIAFLVCQIYINLTIDQIGFQHLGQEEINNLGSANFHAVLRHHFPRLSDEHISALLNYSITKKNSFLEPLQRSDKAKALRTS